MKSSSFDHHDEEEVILSSSKEFDPSRENNATTIIGSSLNTNDTTHDDDDTIIQNINNNNNSSDLHASSDGSSDNSNELDNSIPLNDLPPEILSIIFNFIPTFKEDDNGSDNLICNEELCIQNSTISSILSSCKVFKSVMEQVWNQSRPNQDRNSFLQIKKENYEFSQLKIQLKNYEDGYGTVFDKKSKVVPLMRIIIILLCLYGYYDFEFAIQWMYIPFFVHIVPFTVYSLIGYWNYKRRFTTFPLRLSLNHLASSQIMYLSLISFTISYVTLFYGGIYNRVYKTGNVLFKYEIYIGFIISLLIGITLLDVCLIAIRKYSKTRNFLVLLIVMLPLFIFYSSIIIGNFITISYIILSIFCIVATVALIYFESQKKEKILSLSCIISFLIILAYLMFDLPYFEFVIITSQLLFKLYVGYYGKVTQFECYCESCKYKVVHL